MIEGEKLCILKNKHEKVTEEFKSKQINIELIIKNREEIDNWAILSKEQKKIILNQWIKSITAYKDGISKKLILKIKFYWDEKGLKPSKGSL